MKRSHSLNSSNKPSFSIEKSWNQYDTMKTQIISFSKNCFILFFLFFASSCGDNRSADSTNNGVNFKFFKAATSKLNDLNALAKIFNKSDLNKRLVEGDQIVVTPEMLEEFQATTGIEMNISLENLNTIVNEVFESIVSNDASTSIEQFNVHQTTKNATKYILTSSFYTDISTYEGFDTLPEIEKESLLLSNAIKNDILSGTTQQSSFFGLAINVTSGNCWVDGPNGSGYVSCAGLGAATGALIGGSCCGLAGAGVGALVGWIIGSTMDK